MSELDKSAGRLGKGALHYAEKYGWKILPVHGIGPNGKCTCGKPHGESKDIGKHPAITEWQKKATSDPEQIRDWWEANPEYNVGVFARESGFLVIDVDPRSDGDTSFVKLEERVEGNLPPTVEAITGVYTDKKVRGRHLIYRCKPNEKFIGNLAKEGLKGIDIKHNGYILLAPSRHFTGVTYEWKPGHEPWKMEIADAPEELLAALRPKKRSKGVGYYSAGDWSSFGELEFGGERVDIQTMMEEGIDEGSRAVDIYKLACALANKFGTDDQSRLYIETLMIRFNSEAVRPPMELEGPNSLLMHVHRAIDFVKENPKIDMSWGGLSDWVKKEGAQWAEAHSARQQEPKALEAEIMPADYDDDDDAPARIPFYNLGNDLENMAKQGIPANVAAGKGNLNLPDDPDAVDAEDGGRPGFRSLTDTGNGRRMADSFSSVVKYSPGLGWFYWQGNYWKYDNENLKIREMAKRVSPMIAGEVVNHTDDNTRQALVAWAKQAKSNTRLNSMVNSATSDERVVVDINTWDSHRNLLGASNGIIDLKTGELLTGRPDLYLTKATPVSYTQGLTNTRWNQFLDFVTRGDKEFQEWLQKAVGYTLTGYVNQDVMFLVYGPPGSGKNTFVETIVNALGTHQYAFSLDSQVLASNDGMSSRTDEYYMAELRGRRMIWIDELPDSERLKENQVKKMTGSAELQGRSPGEKPFTFKSMGKLWITTNHKPIITDDAMWRRLRPIPLTNIPEKIDPSLKPYLSDPDGGLPAVLSWAVEGAVKVLNSSKLDPLGWCTVVEEAAAVYKANEDRIGLFLAEETRESEGGTLKVKDLYNAYKYWTEDRGERAMTQTAFQRKLGDRGLEIEGLGSKAFVHGMIRSLSPVDSAADWAQGKSVKHNT